jgi:signal transduction histidine kinase
LRLSSLAGHDWDQALQEILYVASDIFNVGRFNYWRFRDQPRSIVCELGYFAEGGFERGFVLRELDALPYFNEIRKSQIIAVEDALHDPRTECLGSYLKARGITSLLDAPVRIHGDLGGVLCAEQVGPPRSWTNEEQGLMVALSQTISTQLEAHARGLAERREQRTARLADVTAAMAESLDIARATLIAVQRAIPMLGEIAALWTLDDRSAWKPVTALMSESGQEILDELTRRFPLSVRGPGFSSRVLAERQTLFVPVVTPEAARSYGIEREELSLIDALGIRSAVGIPLMVRGQLTGVLVFASTTHTYDQDEMRFAELYAQRIGVLLENLRLYRESQAATRKRDEFVALASHEFRTPITSLRLSAHALARKAAEVAPSTFGALSERILRQTARLERLADRLLDTYQIDRSTPSIEPTTLNLTEVVREVTHTLAETARGSGSELVLSASEPLVGHFDPIRIEQVLTNLIDNALKFGGGKPVEIDVRRNGRSAIITVKDRGIGIPEQDQDRVFARYERASSAQDFGGLGLGLHVVREIVRAHGGEVWLQSEPGKGTAVTVQLPLENGRAS